MGFFSKLFGIKSVEDGLTDYVNYLSVGNDEQMGQTLFYANAVRKQILETTELFDGILDNTQPFVYELNDISKVKKLNNIKNELLGLSDIYRKKGDMVMVSSLNVWVMTFRAFENINCYTLVKKIWIELERGVPYVKITLDQYDKDDKSNNTSKLGFEYLSYIPEMFRYNN
jgi:hypothetical protein